MGKAIKAEMYRFIKSRYVVAILLASVLMSVCTVYVTCSDFHSFLEDTAALESLKASYQQVNWGIYLGSVIPEWCDNETIPIAELFMRNIQSKIFLMFQTLFVVLFIGEEIHSGFMKNINALFPKKLNLVIGKLFVMAVFCGILFLLNLLTMAVAFGVLEGYLNLTEFSTFIGYLFTEYVLYIAYSLIIMLLTYIIKNSAVSLLVGLLEAAGILQVADVFIDACSIAPDSFSVMNYLVSGNIVLLSINSHAYEYTRAFGVAIVFISIVVIATIILLENRDVY